VDPGLRPALLALVEPEERGDPMSPLRWTVKSLRQLARELTRQGHRVGADTVSALLREEGFSLQANSKTLWVTASKQASSRSRGSGSSRPALKTRKRLEQHSDL
jgi:transposase